MCNPRNKNTKSVIELRRARAGGRAILDRILMRFQRTCPLANLLSNFSDLQHFLSDARALEFIARRSSITKEAYYELVQLIMHPKFDKEGLPLGFHDLDNWKWLVLSWTLFSIFKVADALEKRKLSRLIHPIMALEDRTSYEPTIRSSRGERNDELVNHVENDE